MTQAHRPIIAEGSYSGGGQPNTDALAMAATAKIKGTKTLVE